MDRYVVIGNPVAHSLSPRIHAAFARAHDDSVDYSRLEVPLGGFDAHARRFFDEGGAGANVTLPFKQDAFAWAGERSARAMLAGAANVLLRRGAVIVADNTDGAGLAIDLTRNLGLAITGAQILVLGAGGATRGVLGPLLAFSPKSIVIANRTRSRARELHALFASAGNLRACGLDDIPATGYDLVINATSSGTRGEALALPAHLFTRRTFAYDLAYGAGAEPFLAQARAGGARACDGLGMLVEQAAESYMLWRGVRPETAPVLAELGSERR